MTQSISDRAAFLSLMKHEFHAPLRKLNAFAQRLQRREGPQLTEHGQADLARMMRFAEQTAVLVDRVLLYERLTLAPLTFSAVPLHEAIRAAQKRLATPWKEATAVLQLAQLPTVQADRIQIEQLWAELLDNALTFRNPNRPLCLSIFLHQQTNGAVTIACQDNGLGFDPKHEERLFRPFSRLNGRSSQSGAGLGLTICQQIITRHHGEINLTSKPEEGTTLYITLPVDPRNKASI